MAIQELITQYPHISIILFALVISFLISLVNYFFLPKEKMRAIKERQKTLNAQIKEHHKSGNTEKAMELQKQMLPDMMEMMKHSMIPMIITLIPMLILLSFLRASYAQTSIAGSWFWYYLVAAIAGSMIFRKLLKLP